MYRVSRVVLAALTSAACVGTAAPAPAGASSRSLGGRTAHTTQAFPRTSFLAPNENGFDRVVGSVIWENRSVIVSGSETNLGNGRQVCYDGQDSWGTIVASECRSVKFGTRGFDFTLHPSVPHAIRYVLAVTAIPHQIGLDFITTADRPS